MDTDQAEPIVEAMSIPPHVVAAIAKAAVDAYREQERQRRNAAQRERYRRNREWILGRQADLRAARRSG